MPTSTRSGASLLGEAEQSDRRRDAAEDDGARDVPQVRAESLLAGLAHRDERHQPARHHLPVSKEEEQDEQHENDAADEAGDAEQHVARVREEKLYEALHEV